MGDEGSSALVVEVPEAEAVVSEHRAGLDASASLGVPAHVTVLYPFVAVTRLDDDLLATLRGLFARCASFDYRFSATAWFDEAVLFLAPDDPAPFSALIDVAATAFPEHPPYGGEFDEVVPHLTIGDRADLARLRAAEAAVRPRLPVTGVATAVTLLHQEAAGRRWERHTRFALADGQTT
ncbi:MAG TPA: 2'-5' RNA ligase family protein [Jatrophihabitans sp.]|jgi:hypothetical protein|uniref:2'-5' RNA ligase family protein n=1 Tax=Jatrophihabitans sp. TaxID=1932789 RepID=UPI002DFEA4F4|nr:2'-5' RNA ligase family protein [Jatrophihabitans sp.]